CVGPAAHGSSDHSPCARLCLQGVSGKPTMVNKAVQSITAVQPAVVTVPPSSWTTIKMMAGRTATGRMSQVSASASLMRSLDVVVLDGVAEPSSVQVGRPVDECGSETT